jgi:hypothetical protein
MRLTQEEYDKLIKNRLAGKAVAKPKPTVRNKPLAKKKLEAENTQRPIVRITSYTTRLQDPDNVCAKFHIDALRYESLIRDDRAADIELFVYQCKVKTKKEERVEIEIITA